MAREIIYEPHPVSPERKAELRALGFTIIDAIYAPKEQPAPAITVADAPASVEGVVEFTGPVDVAPAPHPLDHDGDGRPGGSLPKAKRGKKAK